MKLLMLLKIGKFNWNLNSEIIEIAEIEREGSVKSKDWILFNKNPEAFILAEI
jgi:hypothetical protein